MRKQSAQRQREVLDVLRRQGRPMTAYEILGELRDTEAGIAPPTVYRTLAALTEEGRAHRLESINAYVFCQHGHADHAPILAICDDCGSVEEHADESTMERLSAIARKSRFHARAHVVEMRGQCAECTA